MSTRCAYRALWVVAVAGVLLCLGRAVSMAQPHAAGRHGMVPTTQAAGKYGPDVVVLRELENLYDAVPFDHAAHAEMAEMWDGCVTCHHRSPHATTRPAAALNGHPKNQDEAAEVPACKSCHSPTAVSDDIHMPNLKGAYHRQCLNCHRDWAGANQCGACHAPKEGRSHDEEDPTAAAVVSRMHPPIPEPDEVVYQARFTPAVGDKVLFRHREHVDYGIRCVNCHRKDNCAHCHDPKADKASLVAQRPMKPGKTWKASHEPCISCHQADRCKTCHYRVPEAAPAPFEHSAKSGQILDKDHADLPCGACHEKLKTRQSPSCGGTECHKATVTFPDKRPGPTATPATRPVVAFEVQWAGDRPRIRDDGGGDDTAASAGGGQ